MKLSRTKIAKLLKINNQSRKFIKKIRSQQRFSKSLDHEQLIAHRPRRHRRSENKYNKRQTNLRFKTLRRHRQPLYNQEGGKFSAEVIKVVNDFTNDTKSKLTDSNLELKNSDLKEIIVKITNDLTKANETNTDPNNKKLVASYINELNIYTIQGTDDLAASATDKNKIVEIMERIYQEIQKEAATPSAADTQNLNPEDSSKTNIPENKPKLNLGKTTSLGVSESDDLKQVPPRPNNNSKPVDAPALVAPTANEPAPPELKPKNTKVPVSIISPLGKTEKVDLNVPANQSLNDTELDEIVKKIQAALKDDGYNTTDYKKPVLDNNLTTMQVFVNGKPLDGVDETISADVIKSNLRKFLEESNPFPPKITINIRTKEYVFFKRLLYGDLYYLIDVQYLRNVVTYLKQYPQFKDLTTLKPAPAGNSMADTSIWEDEEMAGGKRVEDEDDYKFVGFPNAGFQPPKAASIPNFIEALWGTDDKVFDEDKTDKTFGVEANIVFKKAIAEIQKKLNEEKEKEKREKMIIDRKKKEAETQAEARRKEIETIEKGIALAREELELNKKNNADAQKIAELEQKLAKAEEEKNKAEEARIASEEAATKAAEETVRIAAEVQTKNQALLDELRAKLEENKKSVNEQIKRNRNFRNRNSS